MSRVIERTVFKFSELSDSANEAARDAYRLDNHHDEWWDYVYEDAVECGRLIGIDIGTRPVKLVNGKTRHDPDIRFSGFSSQGDGACFTGKVVCADDYTSIENYVNSDSDLIPIAKELALLQVTARLKNGGHLNGTITTSGNYSHSGTMSCSVVHYDPVTWDENDDQITLETETAVLTLMRRFADWIYRQLEAEYEYLDSDECIDEQLSNNDDEFDEDGSIV